jgi:hypothetical protein
MRNAGDPTLERLILRVLQDVNIGDYIVLSTEIRGEGVADGRILASYWFPDKMVSAGELVVLYTRKGTGRTKKLKSGTAHFFYWGLGAPLWTQDTDAAVVIEARDWAYVTRDE